MKKLKYMAVFWALSYLLGLFLLYFFQAKLVFVPTKLSQDFKFKFKNKFVEGSLLTSTSHKVHYLKFEAKNSKATVVFFHGNAGALDGWGHMADAMVSNLNVDVWIMDYPGFGKSSQKFVGSGEQLVKIGQEFLNLVKRESPYKPTILHGRSLGSGIASALTSSNRVAGLILETPYYSTVRLAKEMFPVVPAFILQYRLDNSTISKSRLKKVLVLHGQKDGVIPYQHSIDLKDEKRDLIELVSFPEGGHNDLPNSEKYWKEVGAYIKEVQ